jgi:hypothetical protein
MEKLYNEVSAIKDKQADLIQQQENLKNEMVSHQQSQLPTIPTETG